MREGCSVGQQTRVQTIRLVRERERGRKSGAIKIALSLSMCIMSQGCLPCYTKGDLWYVYFPVKLTSATKWSVGWSADRKGGNKTKPVPNWSTISVIKRISLCWMRWDKLWLQLETGRGESIIWKLLYFNREFTGKWLYVCMNGYFSETRRARPTKFCNTRVVW